jgi:hypothetical protein
MKISFRRLFLAIGPNQTKCKAGLVVLSLLLFSCAKKESALPPSTPTAAFVSDLEDIAKIERKDDVLAFWKQHGWTVVPEKRDDLITTGAKIPDEKLYPFVERYDVHIWLKTAGHDGSLKVYVDEKGNVTYRTIEIVNVKQ